MLLSGTLTAEFVDVDNSAVLSGYNTFDLQVTTTTDWTIGALLVNLSQGTFYQDVMGSVTQSNPALIPFFPSVEFDTAVGGDAPGVSAAGGAGDLGGDNFQFDESELDIAFYNASTSDIGTFGIARITLSDDAVGTWSYAALGASGGNTSDSGTITAGSLLPVTPDPDPAPDPGPDPDPQPTPDPIEGDFDEDGQPDILWQNVGTGETAIWSMDGTTFQSSSAVANATTDTDWRLAGTGDFTGDRKTDTLWQNITDGRLYVEQTDNGVGGQRYNLMTVANLDWKVAGVGDFTGDGKNDILWRNTRKGNNIVWEMDGTTYQQKHTLKRVKNTAWRIGGTGDYNGDGKTDILWRHTRSGRNTIWHMNGTGLAGTSTVKRVRNRDWQIAGTADYTGDGRADILWRNTRTGANLVWHMNGTSFQTATTLQPQADQDWQIAGSLALWEDPI